MGSTNMISWSAVLGAARYVCESTPAASCFGVAENATRTFDPLAYATLYSFKACSVTDFPFGSGTSEWSSAVSSLQLDPLTDYDADGIPNFWEASHSLNPVCQTDGLTDADGDGLTAADEYMADTDPANHDSCLRFVGFARVGEQTTFSWSGGAAAKQVLETSTSLGHQALWIPLLTNCPPTPLTNEVGLMFQKNR